MECELAKIVQSRGALLFGEFTLSSGAKSNYYLDLRRLLGDPESFSAVAAMLAKRSESLESYDTVVGVATAGIPWAAAIALIRKKGTAYVRSEAKGHGTGKLVEGSPRGRCIIVDDVATTGSSVMRAAEALAGLCEVVGILVIVDREEGAREKLESRGLRLESVAKISEIMKCLDISPRLP